MSDYIPVPVAAARKVAAEFRKNIVVIVSWDAERGRIHTTTYGDRPALKTFAAELGERLAAAAGADLSKTRSFEDFRFRPQAETAAEIERLKADQAEMVEVGDVTLACLDTLAARTDDDDLCDYIAEVASRLETVLRKLGWEPKQGEAKSTDESS